MQQAIELSIVVPAWNEASRIYQNLTILWNTVRNLACEIVVVDDGSTDETSAEVLRWQGDHAGVPLALTCHNKNRGKGAAIRSGISCSRGAVVSFIDADLDIDATELLRLYQICSTHPAQVTVGSKRRLTWSTKEIPLLRRLVSLTFSWVVQCLFCLPIVDTQTGLKFFPGNWAREAVRHAVIEGFLFDLELLAMAHDDGLILQEVHVAISPQRTENRIKLRHLLESVGELIAIKTHHYRYATGRKLYADLDVELEGSKAPASRWG